MRILIIGAGKVGSSVAGNLVSGVQRHHDRGHQ